jgi:hypothetical protein
VIANMAAAISPALEARNPARYCQPSLSLVHAAIRIPRNAAVAGHR